jgi:hypothetical protein
MDVMPTTRTKFRRYNVIATASNFWTAGDVSRHSTGMRQPCKPTRAVWGICASETLQRGSQLSRMTNASWVSTRFTMRGWPDVKVARAPRRRQPCGQGRPPDHHDDDPPERTGTFDQQRVQDGEDGQREKSETGREIARGKGMPAAWHSGAAWARPTLAKASFLRYHESLTTR